MRVTVTIDDGRITEVVTESGHARLVAKLPLDTTDLELQDYYDEDATWTVDESNDLRDTYVKGGAHDSMMKETRQRFGTLRWSV